MEAALNQRQATGASLRGAAVLTWLAEALDEFALRWERRGLPLLHRRAHRIWGEVRGAQQAGGSKSDTICMH